MILKTIHRGWFVSACALITLLSLAIAIIVKQGQRILALEALLEDSKSTGLRPGTQVGPLSVRDLAGNTHRIEFDKPQSKPMVLYILRPGCVWCQRNVGDVELLARRLGGKYDFIGLSLETAGLQKFVERERISFPVYTDVPESARRLYRLGNTPETIVVSREGAVLRSWVGAYVQDPIRSEIEKFFSVRFTMATSAGLVR